MKETELNIERIYNDLIGVRIADNFVITSVNIESNIITIYTMNIKTNEQQTFIDFLQFHWGHTYDIINIFVNPFTNNLIMYSCYDKKLRHYKNEHGIFYNLKTGYLKQY